MGIRVVLTVVVTGVADRLCLLRLVRRTTGASLAVVQRALESRAPIYQAEAFLNDFAEVARILRALVSGLTRCGAAFSLFECGHEIDAEDLFNIFEGAETYG